MATTKWTPGPWNLDLRYSGGVLREAVVQTPDVEIAFVENAAPGTDEEAADAALADARLIAAAPDLYEALEAVGSCEKCGEDFGRCMECDRRIAAALARARGETP